jgi:hypothetical protein
MRGEGKRKQDNIHTTNKNEFTLTPFVLELNALCDVQHTEI